MSIVISPINKDKYLLVPVEYILGDKFEIISLFGEYGPPIISRTRKEGEGLYEKNIVYYSPTLFWAIPRDLHRCRLTVVGVTSEIEDFNYIEEFKDKEYLIIKID